MSQDLPTTSYALLGLLSFGDDLTGYELKQRADNTLRFYWVSPAMSQVYTELSRLTEQRLVSGREDRTAPTRRTCRYQITPKGRRALEKWLSTASSEFPALKHPVALRLLLGHLVAPARSRDLLIRYLEALTTRRAELQAVKDSLEPRAQLPGDPFRFPRLVADWGLEYYASETSIVTGLLERLEDE